MGEFVCPASLTRTGGFFLARRGCRDPGRSAPETGGSRAHVYSVETSGIMSGMRRQRGRTVGGTDFLILNQQFNTLIKAGLPILRALDLWPTDLAPKLRPVISQIRDRVREGNAFRSASPKPASFPNIFDRDSCGGKDRQSFRACWTIISRIRRSAPVFGKNSGDLDVPGAAGHRRGDHRHYLVTAVVPKFALLYIATWRSTAGADEGLDCGYGDYRTIFFGGIIAVGLLIVAIYFWSRTDDGGVAFDRLKFRLPIAGDTLLKFQVAQFSRTLATLLSGGTPLVAGLQTASDAISSKLIRGTVSQATQMVREGESLSGALAATRVMPPMALDMIEVGESSGALAPMLTSVAEFYEDEVNLKLGAMVALIEPIMLILMGILVAFILISLYLPIFSLSSSGINK